MATQHTAQRPTPATPGVDFEVERFEWTSTDRLEIAGRWFGVRGRRFVRPVLNVRLPGGRRRLIALLEHKPWAADEGDPWIAAFAWEGEPEALEDVELEVGPSLVVDLPTPRGGVVRAAPREPSAPRLPARAAGRYEELEALRGEAREAAELRSELAAAQQTIEQLRGELEQAREAERRAAASPPPPSPPPTAGAAAARDRDALRAARDSALGERDAALAARNEALAERDAALAVRDEALVERDAAVKARDPLRDELAAAVVELEAVRGELADALTRAQAAEGAREAAVFERDQALSSCDQAVAERDAAVSERDAAIRARDNARTRARRGAPEPFPAPPQDASAEPPEVRPAPAVRPMRNLTRAPAPPTPIVGPVEPLAGSRSAKVAWALRLCALVLLVAVVIALLVALRGVL